ncbi:hypothetical protein RI543_003188 [Arxiozyma heterogenica]|uniref:Uncharacterized protein n=1 Tax=Arxiozyma heterogenica TaxID=278026 RepID=A0AAN7WM39_9SACH|nr:hypothetical protein RI543_003188 [Kazachstania heterogenica]
MSIRLRFYSVVVITFGFDPNNPGSNPGRTFFALIENLISRYTTCRSDAFCSGSED